MSRYDQLTSLISGLKPKAIVEVGTWNGDRAVEMCREALKHHDDVFYFGFDLFDLATGDTDAAELNVKPHCDKDVAAVKLEALREVHPGFGYALSRGNSREMLPKVAASFENFPNDVDFAFIDGGHSVETIRSDFEHLKGVKTVVLDDFYTPDEEGGGPDTERFGCNAVLDGVANMVLPAKDRVKDGGYVQMALVGKVPQAMNLRVKTKNCVPERRIQANIKYASHLIDDWIPECAPHNGVAVLVSGGPSLKDHLDDIRKLARRKNHRVFCVKHSHDILIENKIIPWGCLLLDPRAHVQDFIDNPHPKVRYFVASMCHPTTIDRLVERESQVWGYNALVGAGEQELCSQGLLVSGGSASATRGLYLLHAAMGFLSFRCFGFDGCYYEKPDLSVKRPDGSQRYFKVNVNGAEFWTDAELLAQAQDIEGLANQKTMADIEFFGPGLLAHAYRTMTGGKKDFTEVFEKAA